MEVRCLLLVVFWGCFFVETFAGQGKTVLHFDNATWDFGRISETKGKVTHTFHFTNIHTSPIVIEEVVSTCGCAIPAYSKRPVMPGKTGAVTITFDPKGQTSYISKNIRVVCNSGQSINILKIKGTIHITNSIEEEYPYSLSPEIMADKLTLSYNQLQQNGNPQQLEIKLYNRSAATVKLSHFISDKSGCLEVSMPLTLRGHSFATIKITASPLKGFYGTFNDKIRFLINSVQASSPVRVFGIVIDDMRNVSTLTAPRIKCSQSYFNLGKILTKEPIQKKAKITNEGKKPLIIRKIESPKYIATNIKKELVLKQNETLDILFDLNPSLLEHSLDAKVKIITNDVQRPVYTIVFEGKY